jgi:hypothetical protein
MRGENGQHVLLETPLRYDLPLKGPSRHVSLVLQCGICNHEPDLSRGPARVCPKCHSSSFEWIARRNVQPSERAGHRFKFGRKEHLRCA